MSMSSISSTIQQQSVYSAAQRASASAAAQFIDAVSADASSQTSSSTPATGLIGSPSSTSAAPTPNLSSDMLFGLTAKAPVYGRLDGIEHIIRRGDQPGFLQSVSGGACPPPPRGSPRRTGCFAFERVGHLADAHPREPDSAPTSTAPRRPPPIRWRRAAHRVVRPAIGVAPAVSPRRDLRRLGRARSSRGSEASA